MKLRALILTLTLGATLLSAMPLHALTPEQATLGDQKNLTIVEKVKKLNSIVKPENIVEIKGQLITPQGKGIPNAKLRGRIWRNENTHYSLPMLYTDAKGFWSIKVDKSSVKYISLYAEGRINDQYYFEWVISDNPKPSSVVDLWKKGPIKTVLSPTYATEFTIKDRYGNKFLTEYMWDQIVDEPMRRSVVSGTLINEKPLPPYSYQHDITIKGYKPIQLVTQHDLKKADSITIKKDLLLTPTGTVNTLSGTLKIEGKSEFTDYWIVASTPKDTDYLNPTDTDRTAYIKVNKNGSFKIDNLVGETKLYPIQVNENFVQIESYTPQIFKLNGNDNIVVTCNPNQYMLKFVGELDDVIWTANLLGMRSEIGGLPVNENRNTDKLFPLYKYVPGSTVAIEGAYTLHTGPTEQIYQGFPGGLPVYTPIPEKPIVEVTMSDLFITESKNFEK